MTNGKKRDEIIKLIMEAACREKKCFICGKTFMTTPYWKEDYCKVHENAEMTSVCSSQRDWGEIMEQIEKRG